MLKWFQRKEKFKDLEIGSSFIYFPTTFNDVYFTFKKISSNKAERDWALLEKEIYEINENEPVIRIKGKIYGN